MAQSTTFVISADRFAAAVAALCSPAPQGRLPSGPGKPPIRKGHTMADNAALLRIQQQQQQQQPLQPEPSPALSPQPGHIDQPQHPLPGNPPVMPPPTPAETPPHPGL